MSKYIKLSEEQREVARNTDLAEFLKSQGENVREECGGYVIGKGAEKVTLKQNLWYNHYEQKGGDAVDFVQDYYKLSYPEAVKCLLDGNVTAKHFSPVVKKPKKPFRVPDEPNAEIPAMRPRTRQGCSLCIYSQRTSV